MTSTQSQQVRCPCCGATFALTDDLLVMPPEPDRGAAGASAVPITLVFDGGSRGNPGPGYGSYQLTVRGKTEAPKRLQFGDGCTSNEAEYDTLIAALEAIVRRANDPQRVQLDIRGDSQLVIKQITGAWKIKEPRLRERAQRVHALLGQFGGWSATWHARQNSVEALGH